MSSRILSKTSPTVSFASTRYLNLSPLGNASTQINMMTSTFWEAAPASDNNVASETANVKAKEGQRTNAQKLEP